MDKKLVDKFKEIAETNNVNMEIMFDNMDLLNTKSEGVVVVFDDNEEVIVYTRVTDNPARMLVGPLEFGVRAYSDIQKITIQAPAKEMLAIIESAKEYCGDKKDDMINFVKTTPASSTYHPTPSVNDITQRAGTTPTVYDTNSYGTAGENRAKRSTPRKKNVTVSVNADGSITGVEKIPHVNMPTTHVSENTIM